MSFIIIFQVKEKSLKLERNLNARTKHLKGQTIYKAGGRENTWWCCTIIYETSNFHVFSL